jgi:serine/threonine protein kinase
VLASGTQVGRYVVLDQLGEGAMGEVYRAWDNALDRVVALKLLLPMRAESQLARKRFAREARLAARINHPCVAHIYDVGDLEDIPWIAMEFVPGKQLRSEMGARMEVARILFLARQIFDGLGEAHRQGVVHRDLKPENILISGRDQVKLLDFGLAKPIYDDISDATELTTTGLTGTPRYMAPEQIQGHEIDTRTDIYALGAILYEMVTGSPVHTGNTLGEMLMAVVHKPAPELPASLCPQQIGQTVKRALEKRPEDRFQDIASMARSLDGAPKSRGTSSLEGRKVHVPHPRAVAYTQRGRDALTGMSSSSSVAIDLLEEAIALDPDYALAHALYGEACASLFNTGQRSAQWLDKAQKALETAERLDPELPDVRVTRARIIWTKTFNFPAETALRELRLALAVDPDHVGALRLWATITAHVGLFNLTGAAVARRLSVDPRDETMIGLSASIELVEGRPERALRILDPALRRDPSHEEPVLWWIHGHTLLLLGRTAEARASIDATIERHPEDPLILALASLAAALEGETDEFEHLAESAERCIRGELHPHHAYHLIACGFSMLGRVDDALFWLRRTAAEGMPCATWFERDPFLDNLRRDPSGKTFFEELRRRHEFFVREFPLNDPTLMSFVATEVER